MPIPRHGVAGGMLGKDFHLVSGMVTSAAVGAGSDPKVEVHPMPLRAQSPHQFLDLGSTKETAVVTGLHRTGFEQSVAPGRAIELGGVHRDPTGHQCAHRGQHEIETRFFRTQVFEATR